MEVLRATQGFHALMAYLRTAPGRFDEAEALLLALLKPDCELTWLVPSGMDEVALGRHMLAFNRLTS